MLTLGIDEVGRGCLAGPLVVGAVILADTPLAGLKDSKQLSRLQREKLVPLLKQNAFYIGLGWVEATEIDQVGLSAGLVLAANRATKKLKLNYQRAVIDGGFNYAPDIFGAEPIIKADTSVAAVSAASVLAKVARDELMIKMAEIYPGYGFETNVGYGTPAHLEAINIFGPCPLHRLSFAPLKYLGLTL